MNIPSAEANLFTPVALGVALTWTNKTVHFGTFELEIFSSHRRKFSQSTPNFFHLSSMQNLPKLKFFHACYWCIPLSKTLRKIIPLLSQKKRTSNCPWMGLPYLCPDTAKYCAVSTCFNLTSSARIQSSPLQITSQLSPQVLNYFILIDLLLFDWKLSELIDKLQITTLFRLYKKHFFAKTCYSIK